MNTNLFDSSPNGGGSGRARLERALQEINVDLIARQTRFCRRTEFLLKIFPVKNFIVPLPLLFVQRFRGGRVGRGVRQRIC